MSNGEKYMDDIRRLASIKPHRGPASPGEKEAVDYVESRMKELGLDPVVEPFRSNKHFYISWALHSALCMAGCALAFWNPWVAAALILLVAISYYGETSTRFFIFRRLFPTGPSHHVLGKLKPKGEARKVVYVAAHLDAGQQGFTFNPKSAENTQAFFKKHLGMQPPLLAIIFYFMLINFLVCLLAGAFGLNLLVKLLLVGTGALHLIPIVIFIPHEFAKICPGASDNASAVAVMLELARRFKASPLENTELRFLGDGSEETNMYGMTWYMMKHQKELDKDNTYFLIPETVGAARPRVVVGEGVCWVVEHSHELSAALLMSAKELGHKEVTPIYLRTGGTDASPATVRGFKASVMIAMNENDYPPNYHWFTDIPENIDLNTVRLVTDIFETTIKKIDAFF